MTSEEWKEALRSVLHEELGPFQVRLNNIEKHLENTDKRLDSIENRLDNIENRLDNIENRLDNIEAEQKAIKAEQLLLKQAILETNADVKELKIKMDKLEEIQMKQQQIIDLLSARSIQHEAELKQIK